MTNTVQDVRQRPMKPKRSNAGSTHKVSPMDQCETPKYALDPLVQYISKRNAIWEPFAGTGRMVRHLESFHYRVLGSTIENDENFFDVTCEGYDVIITNPPYSIKYKVLQRCYALGKPFALLVPVETIGASSAQTFMRAYGAEILLLSKRVNFHMPQKGWDSSAQFPVLWLCHGILPAPICYGEINYYPEPEDVAVSVTTGG